MCVSSSPPPAPRVQAPAPAPAPVAAPSQPKEAKGRRRRSDLASSATRSTRGAAYSPAYTLLSQAQPNVAGKTLLGT
jgi:hypothetical protein